MAGGIRLTTLEGDIEVLDDLIIRRDERIAFDSIWAFQLGRAAGGAGCRLTLLHDGDPIVVPIDGTSTTETGVIAVLERLPAEALGRSVPHGAWSIAMRHLPGELGIDRNGATATADRHGLRVDRTWIHWNAVSSMQVDDRRGELRLKVTTPTGDVRIEIPGGARHAADLRIVADIIDRGADGIPQVAERTTAELRRANRSTGRRRRLGALTVLAVAVAAGGFWWTQRPSDTTPRPEVAAEDRTRPSTPPSTAPGSTTEPSDTTPGTTPGATETTPDPTVAIREYEIGDCVLYDRQATTRIDSTVVDCDDEHVFEYVGSIELVGDAFPGRDALSDQLDAGCPALIVELFGALLDPSGLYAIEGLVPKEPAWAEGRREGQCGIGLRSPEPGRGVLKVGAFADLDETFLSTVGTCGIAGEGAPSCSAAHGWEIVGVVDLSDLTEGPSQTARLADELCLGQAEQYLGGPVPAGIDLTILPIPQSTWDRGGRRAECAIASFDPTTGEVVDGILEPLRRTDRPAVPGQCLDDLADLQLVTDCNLPHLAQVSAFATEDTDCVEAAAAFLGDGRPAGFEVASDQVGPLCVVRRAGGGLLPAGSLQALQDTSLPQPGLVEAGFPAREGSNARTDRSDRQPDQTPTP